ncbi:transposable element Tcb2 transposase [Trichonephila clavipes]|nr:transposable element Tcb2 transposase [Trichonephila clavipes]
MSKRKAWRVVGRLEGGQTQAEVAQAIGVLQSGNSRIWNRFLVIGSAGRRPGQGRRRAKMSNEDRYLVLTARRYRNMNASPLQQHLRSVTGTTVSTQTVRNRLHGVGLYARRPMANFRIIGVVAGRQPPPQTLQELKRALLEEWDRIPQLVINSLIDSMPQRCSTLLAVRGNHTP